jgi:hypothetical protein
VQAVITKEEAKKITGGRTPLVPVEYETAVNALQACITLDETKYWSDKADALAAWAKIYRKMLKMHAFRRMGQIAGELRPRTGPTGKNGAVPGAVSLLKSTGLSKTGANAARSLAMMSASKFQKLMRNPKSPITILHEETHRHPQWHQFAKYAMVLRSFTRSNSIVDMAALIKKLGERETKAAKQLCTELGEWFDELDQRLK